jgi:uncharacterized membrane protein YeaQ/YmgE (transglycosylase-associated protein family)
MVRSMFWDIIGFILFGLFVGIVARLLLPGRQKIGLLRTLFIGVVGSLVGGLVASALDTGDVFELNFLGAIVAILAAAVLLGAAQAGGLLEDRRRDELQRPH